LNIN
ncbi:hypothetical protein VCHC17A1_4102B, partial [Vibrio cholerae HC-17A1]|jgi:ankyrin repeat protein